MIALGEATHGTPELLEVKHQLFRVFAETHGFRTLAMEMHGPCCAVMRDGFMSQHVLPKQMVVENWLPACGCSRGGGRGRLP